MKIVILDDERTRRRELAEKLHKKRNEVTSLYGSNDFIEAAERGKFDILLLDLESWGKGKPIYTRFGIAKKLENVPVVFYNAPKNFTTLEDRARHNKDRVLEKPTEADAVIASL